MKRSIWWRYVHQSTNLISNSATFRPSIRYIRMNDIFFFLNSIWLNSPFFIKYTTIHEIYDETKSHLLKWFNAFMNGRLLCHTILCEIFHSVELIYLSMWWNSAAFVYKKKYVSTWKTLHSPQDIRIRIYRALVLYTDYKFKSIK